jgi:hypothetical protein
MIKIILDACKQNNNSNVIMGDRKNGLGEEEKLDPLGS